MRTTRRTFLQASAAVPGFWVAGVQRGFGQDKSPNAKLNVAFIGSGGRGGANLGVVGPLENVVALCDTFAPNLEKAAAKYPGAKKYVDFRKMWDDEKSFDAVVVSTAEHTHAFATLPALKLKKHVYCEKPLMGSAIAVERASDLDIAETRERSAGGRIVRVQIALSYVAFMPPFGTSGRTRRSEDADAAATAVATGHFEQACRVKGVVKVGNRRLEVQGIGVRDKSWGPRDWSAVWGWRWFSIPFDRDLALGVHSLILPGREVQAGWVWRDHRLVKVKGFTLDSDFDGRFHRAMRIVAEDVEGTKYEVDGAVRSVIPLRIGATRVAEGLTEFRMDGRTATGIAEYLDNTRNP